MLGNTLVAFCPAFGSGSTLNFFSMCNILVGRSKGKGASGTMHALSVLSTRR